MEFLTELLTELHSQSPVSPGKHNITLDNGRLSLTVFRRGLWHSFYLDDGDFRSDPAELANSIVSYIDRELLSHE